MPLFYFMCILPHFLWCLKGEYTIGKRSLFYSDSERNHNQLELSFFALISLWCYLLILRCIDRTPKRIFTLYGHCHVKWVLFHILLKYIWLVLFSIWILSVLTYVSKKYKLFDFNAFRVFNSKPYHFFFHYLYRKICKFSQLYSIHWKEFHFILFSVKLLFTIDAERSVENPRFGDGSLSILPVSISNHDDSSYNRIFCFIFYSLSTAKK